MTDFYETDANDPEAPVKLGAFMGFRPGDRVDYVGPNVLGTDGETFVVTALYSFGDDGVQAILNGGEYEVSAENLCRVTP